MQFHDIQPNDSQSSLPQSMHKLCFSLHAMNRMTYLGGATSNN